MSILNKILNYTFVAFAPVRDGIVAYKLNYVKYNLVYIALSLVAWIFDGVHCDDWFAVIYKYTFLTVFSQAICYWLQGNSEVVGRLVFQTDKENEGE